MSGGSQWRSASTAAQYAEHDYADFAQEFLRRNAEYRRDYANIAAKAIADPDAASIELEGLAGRWGLRFPCKPR
jgi:Family of unknown function (DUF6499)